MRAAAAILVVASGCNSILGIGDVKSSAGGPDAAQTADAGIDAAPLTCPTPSNGNVVGCWFDEFVSSDIKTTTAAHDLGHFTIQALVPDSTQAGFHTAAAQIIAPGVFTIDAIPDATTYYLEVLDNSTPGAVPTYYATSLRALDLSVVAVGRPGASQITKQTTVTLDIDKMTAWQPPDYLLLDSFSVDTENFVGYPSAPSDPPTTGATSIGLTLNWQDSYGFVFPAMLLDLADHDDLWVTHNTSITVNDQGNHPYTGQIIADSFTSTNVDMKDGQPLTLSGSFNGISTTASQDYTVNLNDLRTAISDGNHYYDENVNCGVLVNPASSYGNGIGPTIAGFTADLVANETSTSQAQAVIPTIHYGSPYPSNWPVVIPCGLLQTRLLRAPGATKVSALSSSITVWDNGQTPYTFRSQGHAPTGVTVGGQPLLAGGAVGFDGTAPVTMMWSAVPNTDSYGVDVYEIALDVTKTTLTHLAGFRTGGTSLALPASLFMKGHFYVFVVYETRQTAAYSLGQLNRTSTPRSGGGIVSGVFRFSNDCGNGTVDAGEDCDTKGDSVTCNAACTTAKCGDGYLNTAAGEQCDEVFDSPHCDGDCTLPVCGDGYWNQSAGEECDDGNTTNGDGCSSQCKLEHCGNGTVDDFEDCDDGNNVNGDGCSAFCRVEPGWTCDSSKNPSVCTE